ncbi:MAG: hypothetical protein ABJO72_05015 [Hyphomicrobiales bacterium]
MAGLIQEIQQKALQSDLAIDDLLRMVKLAAAKLGLDSLGSWVEQELNGYHQDVPEYREIYGRPYAYNPYNGWIPLVSNNQELIDTISMVPVQQSIGSIHEMLSKSNDGEFHFQLPSNSVTALNSMMDFQTSKVIIKVGRSNLISAIGVVRNRALDWAIEMEKQGIKGEGLSFNSDEKQQAQAVMNTFNIGDIHNFTGTLGSQNSGQITIVNSQHLAEIKEAESSIREALPMMELDVNESSKIKVALDAIKTEVEASEPRPSKLKALFSDLHSVLTGAAGNLTAQGALALIANIMRSIG